MFNIKIFNPLGIYLGGGGGGKVQIETFSFPMDQPFVQEPFFKKPFINLPHSIF